MMNYHLMMVSGIVLLLIFSIVPMFGVAIAFQDYLPAKGILSSKWVGWENFSYMFSLPDSKQIFVNTITIALMKIAAGLVVPFVLRLLNEARLVLFKRTIQTIVYLPHFMSWVILSGILLNMLTLDGLVNQILGWFGQERVLFLPAMRGFGRFSSSATYGKNSASARLFI